MVYSVNKYRLHDGTEKQSCFFRKATTSSKGPLFSSQFAAWRLFVQSYKDESLLIISMEPDVTRQGSQGN